MSDPVKTAIVGASGYSGETLLRILLTHPHADLVAVTSRQHAGKPLSEVFPRFRGSDTADSLRFATPNTEALAESGATVIFLALPHGLATEFAIPLLGRGLRVIDLSADFRLNDAAVYEEFYGEPHPAPHLLDQAVYGIPEIYADAIRDATLVASPGCYPTSILLPLIPLLKTGAIDRESIRVSSMSGVSGAGRKASELLLYAECNESVRAYSVPKHRHLSEIEQELSLASEGQVIISFTPHLIPVTAGIHTTTYADCPEIGAVTAALESAYAGAPFVRLLGEGGCPDTKHVVGTNFLDIGWSHDPRTGRLVLLSAEDNLGKGAASQAVQSFNLMCGFDETTGLLRF